MTDPTQTHDAITAANTETYDVVVAGSGCGALSAAISAADGGMTVLMIESAPTWGGSTVMSGGGLWLPNNPLMRHAGVGDSREEALEYLEQTVGDAGPATSRARKEAFVDNVAAFVQLAEKHGAVFARSTDYPDYYPELPGGKIGRAIEHEPFDVNAIGEWAKSVNPGGVPAPAMTDDFWLLSRAWSSPDGMVRGAKVVGRVLKGVATRKKLYGMGTALAASMLGIARKLDVDLWLNAPLDDLIVEDGRVVGVLTVRDGRPVQVRARRGVVLGTGGFDHNDEMRRQYHGISGEHSSGSPNNLGGGHLAAERAGAALDLMDDAWWGGSIPGGSPVGGPGFLVSERAMPYSILVDAAGNRFANEAESYVDLGHHMREHEKQVPGRFWMIADVRHARKYLRSYAMDPRAVKKMMAAGVMHKVRTLTEVAQTIGADPATLRCTVDRFNAFARSGVDHDFGRGNSAYDRYYSDPMCRPNPNLGPIEKEPFTVVQIVAGDLGTKGGVLTDEYARALRPDGSVIEGLYATGNASASVMGNTYPGPGSTLGPAAVFGYIAGRHLAVG